MSKTEIFQYARNCQREKTCPKTRRGKWNKSSNTSAGICDLNYALINWWAFSTGDRGSTSAPCTRGRRLKVATISIIPFIITTISMFMFIPYAITTISTNQEWRRACEGAVGSSPGHVGLRQVGFSKTLDPHPHDHPHHQWCHRLCGGEHLWWQPLLRTQGKLQERGNSAFNFDLFFEGGGGGAGLLDRRRQLLPLHQRGLDWPRGGGQLQGDLQFQLCPLSLSS